MTRTEYATISTADFADIKVVNVKKYFKEVKAVDGIDLEIRAGEFVALLGPNGAGKTTLVEMIEGIQQPDTGEILIRGKHWKHHADELHRILGISLQENHFFDKLTVLETLSLFASFYGLPGRRNMNTLEITGLQEKGKEYVKNLSGGQRQKLALGIALLNDAQILLLDEPTTGLDPASRREIWNILNRLRSERNITLILTTHYMEEAEFLCERIIIMDNGKILAEGTLQQLLLQSKSHELIEFSLEQEIATTSFAGIPGVYKFIWDDKLKKGQLLVDQIVTQLPLFLNQIDNLKVAIKSLECRQVTLDDLFISMTGRHLTQT
jgi:ABC-2 type transport system ATP-binding protein